MQNRFCYYFSQPNIIVRIAVVIPVIKLHQIKASSDDNLIRMRATAINGRKNPFNFFYWELYLETMEIDTGRIMNVHVDEKSEKRERESDQEIIIEN